jgi:nucleoside-diphosphate-sugar epimerase
MTPKVGTVAITGSSGYLGGIIREQMRQRGVATIELVRTPKTDAARPFQLDRDPDPGLLEGVDVLIHCAYDMTVRSSSEIRRVNIEGTARLLALAENSGVRRSIVLSSMSAWTGTEQLYGRAKLEIEELSLAHGAVPIRPGLVYGPESGGMMGTLRRLSSLPVIPLVGGNSIQFTVHQDDFVAAVWALVSAPELPSLPIGVANPVPVPFRHVLERLVWDQDRNPRFLPVSWQLLKGLLDLAERCKLPLPVRSDSLLGLVKPASCVPNLEVLDGLGIQLRRYGQPVPSAELDES